MPDAMRDASVRPAITAGRSAGVNQQTDWFCATFRVVSFIGVRVIRVEGDDLLSDETQSILDGLVVVDLTLAMGEFAGRVLADLGADVIAVEPLQGSPRQ